MARYKGPRLTTAPPSTMTIQALDGLSSEEGDNSQPEERDDNQSEEGNGSQPETKDHLCEDLESILKANKLEAPGSYAYSSLLPFAPHACLNIEGLGRIGLPLSEIDAKRVIAHASQAPYGRGSQTIVDKEVRDTWEIDPARVKFDNPNWIIYVRDLAVQTVCASLRVKKYDAPPRCEFYKLLLYETGSHFLPHRDTQNSDGMFATMIILLPSEYTGGEIHLTHASKTQVIDFSDSSVANTAVLAWYTDVLHEVKPVTSGCRLALSYNLIYASSHLPLPRAPTYDGPYAKLRQVLRNWKEGKYKNSKEREESEECEEPDERYCIAYLLKHQYSEVDFSHGASCLKGDDDERVTLVHAAAEGLGLVIFLAEIKYQFLGDEDDFEGYGRMEHRHFDDDFSDGGASISLSKIVDLSGHVVLDSHRCVEIDEDCFLPRDALDDSSPDGKEEERTGETHDQLLICVGYHRCAFIMILSDKLPHILMKNGGVGYIMKLFKESLSDNAPTEKGKSIAKHIISNLQIAGSDRVTALKALLDYAYKWKDVEMWQDLVKSCEQDIRVQGGNGLVEAWRVFRFGQTRAGIENLLLSKRLPDRLAFITAIRQAASESDEKDVIEEWCMNQATVALTSYVSPDDNDVSLLVSMACENGIQCVGQIPIGKIVPEKAYQFFTALVKGLLLKRTVILEKTVVDCAGSNDSQSEANHILDEFIRRCLDCAGKHWNVVPRDSDFGYQYPSNTSNQKGPTRVLNLVELCLLTCETDTCGAFLDRVWKMSGEVVIKFNQTYTPLVPELCKLLRKTKTDICAPPFLNFFRLLISHYLCYVLRTKTKQVKLSKIGCGCADCQELDRFLAGRDSQHIFSNSTKQREDHLKSQVDNAQDLVVYGVQYGNPHCFSITKTGVLLQVAADTWEQRLEVVKDMFKAIGAENVEKIMGDRYADVAEALKGQNAFRLDQALDQQQNVPDPVSKSTTNATTSVVGRKRKR